jgi:hypothetical protein
VQAIVDDTKAKVSVKQRVGSPFAHHLHSSSSSSSSDDDEVAGNNSWFKKLYQHEVQRGLERLSGQYNWYVDVDMSRDSLLNPHTRQQPPQKQQSPCTSSMVPAKTAGFVIGGDEDSESTDDWGGARKGRGVSNCTCVWPTYWPSVKPASRQTICSPTPPAANATPNPKRGSAGASFAVELQSTSSAMGVEVEAFARATGSAFLKYTRSTIPKKLALFMRDLHVPRRRFDGNSN